MSTDSVSSFFTAPVKVFELMPTEVHWKGDNYVNDGFCIVALTSQLTFLLRITDRLANQDQSQPLASNI